MQFFLFVVCYFGCTPPGTYLLLQFLHAISRIQASASLMSIRFISARRRVFTGLYKSSLFENFVQSIKQTGPFYFKPHALLPYSMDGYLKEMLASDFLEAVMRFETLVFIEKLYF